MKLVILYLQTEKREADLKKLINAVTFENRDWVKLAGKGLDCAL